MKPPAPISFPSLLFYIATCIIAGLIVSCSKDELISSVYRITTLSDPKNDWTPEEKLFFNFNNHSSILGSPPLLPRTSFTPSILAETYNELLEANELDSFVYSVIPRLGYPVWLSSTFDVSTDSSNYFVYVPFVKPDSNYISAYLVGYKDYANSNSALIMNIHTRVDLDSIKNAQKDITSNTCHELMRFFAFDSLLFNNSASEFYDLFCEVCLDGTSSGIADPPFVSYCDTTEFEICYYAEDLGIDDTDLEELGWEVVSHPGSYGGGPGGSFTVIFGGIYSGFSPLNIPIGGENFPSGNDNIGQLLADIGNAIGQFFGGGFSAIGDFFSGLFGKKNKYRKCPFSGLTSPDDIETRTQVFICSKYVMIRCNNGRWWETVALIPCDGCNVAEELEKEKEHFCREVADSLMQIFDLPVDDIATKRLILSIRECCNFGDIDLNCIEQKYNLTAYPTVDGFIDYIDLTHGEYTGDKDTIPHCLQVNDSTKIEVVFGMSNDSVSADQEVAICLIDCLVYALNCASEDYTINSIYIKCTTNGVHSAVSNHSKALAIDISRINGETMLSMDSTELLVVAKIQDCLEDYSGIRENFGPSIQKKLNADWTVSGHKDHIHFSVNSDAECTNYNQENFKCE